ncbi:MAG TPA: DUF2769 domain-containing protein [Methanomassiliicoccales archaeon]|nr:DUF2769 domain-containing protein [Methanomassiliicoccales archaeon]
MDRFESEIKRLDALRPEELEKWIDQMKGLCRCPGCATYTECNAKSRELLYCYLGKSVGCDMQARTCDCPVCKVTDELGSKYSFYYLNGPEKVLRE